MIGITSTNCHTGVSGAKVYWMRSANGKLFWCKMAVAIMGNFNNENSGSISPFSEDFNDCYVEGRGSTREEAYSNMNLELKNLANMLWDDTGNKV